MHGDGPAIASAPSRRASGSCTLAWRALKQTALYPWMRRHRPEPLLRGRMYRHGLSRSARHAWGRPGYRQRAVPPRIELMRFGMASAKADRALPVDVTASTGTAAAQSHVSSWPEPILTTCAGMARLSPARHVQFNCTITLKSPHASRKRGTRGAVDRHQMFIDATGSPMAASRRDSSMRSLNRSAASAVSQAVGWAFIMSQRASLAGVALWGPPVLARNAAIICGDIAPLQT